jgi:hypothetical protein
MYFIYTLLSKKNSYKNIASSLFQKIIRSFYSVQCITVSNTFETHDSTFSTSMKTVELPQPLVFLFRKATSIITFLFGALLYKKQPLATKCILILAFSLLIFSNTVNSQVVQSFTPRYQTTQKGGIVFLANTAVGCSANPTTAGGACQSGSAQVPPSGNYVNNTVNSNATYIDIDGNPSTFMSSSDSLNLPSCSSITWAGLFWGAYGTDPANNKNIKIKANNGAYQNITADASLLNSTGYDLSLIHI